MKRSTEEIAVEAEHLIMHTLRRLALSEAAMEQSRERIGRSKRPSPPPARPRPIKPVVPVWHLPDAEALMPQCRDWLTIRRYLDERDRADDAGDGR